MTDGPGTDRADSLRDTDTTGLFHAPRGTACAGARGGHASLHGSGGATRAGAARTAMRGHVRRLAGRLAPPCGRRPGRIGGP